jgi:hypothetical protein
VPVAASGALQVEFVEIMRRDKIPHGPYPELETAIRTSIRRVLRMPSDQEQDRDGDHHDDPDEKSQEPQEFGEQEDGADDEYDGQEDVSAGLEIIFGLRPSIALDRYTRSD